MADSAKAKILSAAAELFLEMNPSAITHRTIAAKAGVPLGSTTYHFASLEELLANAVDFALTATTNERRAWLEKVTPASDLSHTLIQMVLPEEFWNQKAAVNLYLIWLQGLGYEQSKKSIKVYTEHLIEDIEKVAKIYSLKINPQLLLAILDGRILQWIQLDLDFPWLENSIRADFKYIT